jgi:carbonyl reductase 1
MALVRSLLNGLWRFADDDADENVVNRTLQTNYYGTLAATQNLLPLIRPGGRLVNVCSTSGHLNKYSPAITEAFISASKTSVSACSALMEKFTADVKAGKQKAEGWPSAAYAVSKAGEIAFTKVVAMEEEKSGRGVLVNACCPGCVNTDMTKGNGSKTVDEGAKTPVMLALGEIGGKAGEFWQHERLIVW